MHKQARGRARAAGGESRSNNPTGRSASAAAARFNGLASPASWRYAVAASSMAAAHSSAMTSNSRAAAATLRSSSAIQSSCNELMGMTTHAASATTAATPNNKSQSPTTASKQAVVESEKEQMEESSNKQVAAAAADSPLPSLPFICSTCASFAALPCFSEWLTYWRRECHLLSSPPGSALNASISADHTRRFYLAPNGCMHQWHRIERVIKKYASDIITEKKVRGNKIRDSKTKKGASKKFMLTCHTFLMFACQDPDALLIDV